MPKSKMDMLRDYMAQLTKTEPGLQHALRLASVIEDVEQLIDVHIKKRAAGVRISFDALLRDLQSKYKFNMSELEEEIQVGRDIWGELEQEREGKSVRRFDRCRVCRVSVSLAVIAMGGILGLLSAYSAGTAVPLYFITIAEILGISVTALYVILSGMLAGTIALSSFPREVCERRGLC